MNVLGSVTSFFLTLLQRDEAYRALRVSQQQLLDTKLVPQRLMNSDGLTGLSNRRHFDKYRELEWHWAIPWAWQPRHRPSAAIAGS